jgi:uncharacterized protein YggE
MAAGDDSTLISVRGEARRTVAPDQVALSATVDQVADSKVAATAMAAAIWDEVRADLAELGAVKLSVGTMRDAVTWSMHSIHTHPEYLDKRTGEHGPTGRHIAVASVMINVRDFDRLDNINAALTAHDEVNISSVDWSVDVDNRGWALVRADAIHAALLQGRDYASALGGSIVRVEHIADAGLLGGEGSRDMSRRMHAVSLSMHGGDDQGGVSLSPVPQELSAVIEARLSAIVGPILEG